MGTASLDTATAAGTRETTGSLLADLPKLALIAGQLLLLGLVIRYFQIESQSFFRIFLLSAAGFVVHALLPLRWRLPFFAALSVAGLGLVFGPRDGAWVLGLGLGLLGIAHLPVRWGLRVGLLLGAAALLGSYRANLLPFPGPGSIWAILASMFMFRLAIYMYDRKHAKEPARPARTLAYFFMLPNACFPLFPLVDYKNFERGYYAEDAWRLHQRGIQWMVRGLTHLIGYRLIYYYFTFDPAELHGFRDLALFVYGSFALYLKVSGTFHFAVGLLHLFGFQLPATNHRYWLASSFTELWRRNNIYWKDAMMKLVYYPSFFEFRKRTAQFRALTWAMVLVMFLTWALHSYQWFWLRGQWLLTPQDMGFWAILGGLVVWTSVREAAKGAARSRAPAASGWDWRRGASTIFTVTLLSVLWTLWGSDTVADWLALWPLALRITGMDAVLLLGFWGAWLAIAGWNWDPPALERAKKPEPLTLPGLTRLSLLQGSVLVALLATGFLAARGYFGGTAGSYIASLRVSRLSAFDERRQNRGYYEDLSAANRSAELWGMRGVARDLFEHGFSRRHDFVGKEMLPGLAMVLDGKEFHTNQWGMRDREYTRAKPSGTYRIALLGPSDVAGLGVHDQETFDERLEARFAEGGAGRHRKVEVLNFGIPNFSHLQQTALFEEKVAGFTPDAVIMVSHATDREFNLEWLQYGLETGIPIPYDSLARLVAFSGAAPGMAETAMKRALNELMPSVMRWNFTHFAQVVRARGAVPVLLVLRPPTMNLTYPLEDLEAASAAGIEVVDFQQVWGAADEVALRVSEVDKHMNAAGHAIVADSLHAQLRARGAFGLRGAP